jgi:hypothetical protein
MGLLMRAARDGGGYVTTSLAAGVGISQRQLERLAHGGALRREARGVYRVTGFPSTFAGRVLAASTRSGGVASHQTAARLWGFHGPGFEGDQIHVTVPHGWHPTPAAGVVVHQTRRDLRGLTTVRSGVEVTRPLRTILDVSGQPLDDPQLRGYLDHCIIERLLTIRSLERLLSSKRPGVRGLDRLRQVVDGACDIDSGAEAELLAVLAGAGIECPVTQFVVRDEGRFLGRVDLAWPERRVALELDGYRYHSDSRTFVSDRERGNRIVVAGWTLLRTTPATLRQVPHTVVADVRAALGRSTAA